MTSSIQHDDIADIIKDCNIPWGKFKNTTIFVTGSTGLIGKLLIQSLLNISIGEGLDLKIIAAVRDIAQAKKIFSASITSLNHSLFFYEYDLIEEIVLLSDVDYIFHGACVTDSSFFVSNPIDTMWSIALGTKNILEFSARANAKSIVMFSTMEVYGYCDSFKITENDSGFLEQMIARSSYPQGKRFAETLSAAYWFQYYLPIKVARLTQTLGPDIRPTDQRVFAQFVRCMVESKDIILHTAGRTRRDYLYVSDAVRALITILLKGENGESYNVSNENNNISVFDMANLCASIHGGITVKFDQNNNARSYYMREHTTSLDTSKLTALGWEPSVTIKEAYSRIFANARHE